MGDLWSCLSRGMGGQNPRPWPFGPRLFLTFAVYAILAQKFKANEECVGLFISSYDSWIN